MDVTSNITCLLIDICSIANEAVLPEKSNLNLTGNTDDKEEIGKRLQRDTPSKLPTIGQITVFLFVYF